MSTLSRPVLGIVLGLFSFCVCAGQAIVSVEWPDSAESQQARRALLRSGMLEQLVEIANQHTALQGELRVLVSDATRSGFDPASNTIVLSYRLWNHVGTRAAAVGNVSQRRGGSAALAEDAMLYSAIQQLARAVLAQQDPATQRLGADAVSDLATVMLLELLPNGASVAQNTIMLFGETYAVDGEDSYWLDRAPSIDRLYSGTCHRHGAAFAQRRGACEQNYRLMVSAWASVFEPEVARRMLQTASR